MTTNRALLSLAVVLVLPTSAAAQRFAGVIDATGMVARPTAPPTATPIPGLPTLIPTAAVLIPPTIPGFFTPRTVPQLPPAEAAVVNNAFQPVFVPTPMMVPPSEVIEEVPLDAEALPAVSSNARALSPRATTRARGTTVFAPVDAAPTVGSASGRCQAATLRQLRASNVNADDLRFAGNSTAMMTLSDGSEVRGSGVLRESGRTQWRTFRYVCTSSGPTAQTRAVVTLAPAR
jgi:hypothetical protein